MLPRSLAVVVFILAVGLAPPVAAQEAKIKVQLVGPDGKPTASDLVLTSRYGDGKPLLTTKTAGGEIIVVTARDDKGQVGSTVFIMPKTGDATVTIKVGAAAPGYWERANNARKASEAGDEDAYNAAAWDAVEALDRERAQLADERKLVEQWRDENNLPPKTAAEVDAIIKNGKAQGISDKSPATRLLKRYKKYLTQLEDKEATLQSHEADFKTLQPPQKRTSMAPGSCPNGEGGLLAGFLNDLTGSDLAAACDIDTKREKNKDRKDPRGGRDHHEHD
ncbi:MAG: hypothetical protein HC868_18110 [Sphingomonadales bacterium]|nr:hypothetical protein [Sphingomonadales bacterium]